ncbi:dihydrolipoamide dehydrogenase [Roseiarcus fermentans]|uniref:Dihydrolipoyl dehydrogenase n=1 Tax=Roseiarcus fermentans TaxID=1473586 RepID=A0A366FUY1_9HYPH|nr:dihydrolipoyl dehydrogenase [Roseiarcus fermentans]RBP18377.1 dihydrolipoamide dehydrogenase [Roseiarcus fermentans]
MSELSCKVLIIGGGPGGYVAAIRAGELGLDTVLVEDGRFGGTCLHVGCIPSKAIIHAADAVHALAEPAALAAIGVALAPPVLDYAKTVAWKDAIVARLSTGVGRLLDKAKVRTIRGRAALVDGKTAIAHSDTGDQRISCEHLVIATGSEPFKLAALPFGGDILSSTEALALTRVPGRLAVVGAGYIGMELGTAFAKLGAKVTIVEALPRILPLYDEELSLPVARRAADLGVDVRCGARALRFGEGALHLADADGEESAVAADKVLVAVGRRPRTAGFGLERLDLTMAGPFVRIDERCATSMRNVWAVGDVTGEPMLAHRAMAQGEMVAEIIAGRKCAFDHRAIPSVCFTDPEIVAVGLSPEAARAAHGEIVTGLFPFRANGRAMTKQDDEGFVRIVARNDNHVVLGVQAVGAGVSELSSGFALAIEMGARLEDVAGTIHAHPTQGEAFHEAALKALGHPLHI